VRPCLENKAKRARGIVQVVECLPGKCKTLSANNNTTKKKKKKKGKGKERT
jgi:hypothetical protein